jgi:hypothetical protein
MQGVFFLHLPKCAGTTIWYALRRLYGRDRVFRLGTPGDRHRLEEMSPRERRGFAALGGHGSLAHFGQIVEDLDQRYKITVLREPVERIISEYEFIRSQTKHPKHAVVTGQSLLEFGRSRETVNLQSRLICGKPDAVAALETLDARFNLVGTTRDIDAIVAAVYRRSRRRLEKVPRKNEGGPKQPVHRATLDALAELNAADMALYDAIARRSEDRRSGGAVAMR